MAPAALAAWLLALVPAVMAVAAGSTPPARAHPPAPPAPPGYVLIPELSDEFGGSSLDPTKWATSRAVVSWPGRAPGLFDPANVVVGGGSLQLWARAAKRNASWPAGFDNYTTAAVNGLRARVSNCARVWVFAGLSQLQPQSE